MLPLPLAGEGGGEGRPADWLNIVANQETGCWSSATVKVNVDAITTPNLDGARLDMIDARRPFTSLPGALHSHALHALATPFLSRHEKEQPCL